MKYFVGLVGYWLALTYTVQAQTFTRADTAVATIYYTIEAGQYDHALTLIQDAEKEFPEKYTYLLAYKTNCYLLQGKAAFALQALNEAEALYKDSVLTIPIIWYNIGWAYATIAQNAGSEFEKTYQEALIYFNKTIEASPNFSEAHYGIATYHILRANMYLDKANNTPLQDEQAYKDAKNDALAEYEQALPYLYNAEKNAPGTYTSVINDVTQKIKYMAKP